MTEAMLKDLEKRKVITPNSAQVPPAGQTSAHPEADEVVVFWDFFTAGLHFLLDPVAVEIFQLFKVYLHQMTPTLFSRLNVYFWLLKTCKLSPSTK